MIVQIVEETNLVQNRIAWKVVSPPTWTMTKKDEEKFQYMN